MKTILGAFGLFNFWEAGTAADLAPTVSALCWALSAFALLAALWIVNADRKGEWIS